MLKPITTAPIRANPTKVFLSIFTCLPYYIIILVSYLSIAALINDRNKGCGINPESDLVEIIEIPTLKWFIGVQFHPEYSSTVLKPHPLFLYVFAFIGFKSL